MEVKRMQAQTTHPPNKPTEDGDNTHTNVSQVPSRMRFLRRRSTHYEQVKEIYDSRKADTINMENSMVSLDVINSICPYLSYLNTSLVSLNISHNFIGPEGAAAIGEALITNNTLQILIISNCGITGSPYRPNFTGVQQLSRGFQCTRSKLIFLDISGNALMPAGTRIICAALSFHPNLASLDISKNCASVFDQVEGEMGISTLIECNKLICRLDISGNVFRKSGSRLIVSALKRNKSLTHFKAIDCHLMRWQRVSLEESLSSSSYLHYHDID